jgi:hypothetical protein
MDTGNHTRGSLALLIASQRQFDSLTELARRIGKPSSKPVIWRHLNGKRKPAFAWRMLYQRKFGIDPLSFEQPPTRAQLRQMRLVRFEVLTYGGAP